ncbi:hypothetical protein INT44_003160 [Umbelopsis vinacea]|uniref:Uncharacterized protein n=1 Tax=Umbelopsis vinacea TaxID=44442 RepID=A0A8H7Q6T1_9FUNG|nr:hypothetical protein INT44_003160 [Umbelopsis vinacea]
MSLPHRTYSRHKMAVRQRSMSLTDDFECRLFDSPYRSAFDSDDNVGYSSYSYEPVPVLVMARQQGFVFNEEVLVSPLRRRSGYETLASMCKTNSSSGSEDSCGSSQDELDDGSVNEENHTQTSKDTTQVPERVVEIKLRATECDIWPE